MSIILDKVSCLYSKGTTYETYGIRDINLKIEDENLAENFKLNILVDFSRHLCQSKSK